MTEELIKERLDYLNARWAKIDRSLRWVEEQRERLSEELIRLEGGIAALEGLKNGSEKGLLKEHGRGPVQSEAGGDQEEIQPERGPSDHEEGARGFGHQRV